MSAAQLRSIDLNLLLPLQTLLEERNVTRAARRINLSQSAMSRALERLRATLGDDLLIRSEQGYQLTPRGHALRQELELLVPRLEQLWSGEAFSPERTDAHVRLAMTDYAATVVLPGLLSAVTRLAPGLTVEVIPWHEKSYEDLVTGTAHLVFSPLAAPPAFRVERLFEERFVCLLGRHHPCKRRSILLKEYLRGRHVSVETWPKQENLIDRPLAEAGHRRNVALHLPYLLPAMQVLETTDLLLTTPSRLATGTARDHRLRQVSAPREIPSFHYSVVWHPRLEREALHAWLRGLVRGVCRRRLPNGETKDSDRP